jgi:hypothetical protein
MRLDTRIYLGVCKDLSRGQTRNLAVANKGFYSFRVPPVQSINSMCKTVNMASRSRKTVEAREPDVDG